MGIQKSRKLVLIGSSFFAEIAHQYFTHDSAYDVVAFALNRAYIKDTVFCGLPVVALEDLPALYPAATHDVHVAIGYTRMNRIRTLMYDAVKALGYRCANYISSRAFVWPTTIVGDNVFIFEDNTVQPFVTIGSNNVFWSGNHIGHHSTLGDHNFLSSHVVISGNCRIGDGNFWGVNSGCANDLSIGDGNFVAMGAMLARNAASGGFYTGNPARLHRRYTAASAMSLQEKLR